MEEHRPNTHYIVNENNNWREKVMMFTTIVTRTAFERIEARAWAHTHKHTNKPANNHCTMHTSHTNGIPRICGAHILWLALSIFIWNHSQMRNFSVNSWEKLFQTAITNASNQIAFHVLLLPRSLFFASHFSLVLFLACNRGRWFFFSLLNKFAICRHSKAALAFIVFGTMVYFEFNLSGMRISHERWRRLKKQLWHIMCNVHSKLAHTLKMTTGLDDSRTTIFQRKRFLFVNFH